MHVGGTPGRQTTHPKLNGPDAPVAGLALRQEHVVVVLGFCGLVSAADNWFVSPALPAIANTLAVAPTAAAIILTAYLVPYGALQPVCGRIGDGVGRLRLLRSPRERSNPSRMFVPPGQPFSCPVYARRPGARLCRAFSCIIPL